MAIGMLTVQAQENLKAPIALEVGDIIQIAQPSFGDTYRYVKFPKKNIIIKRGGVATYKMMPGEQVVITKIKTNKRGNTKVTVERSNGKRFFNIKKEIDIYAEKALAAEEINL